MVGARHNKFRITENEEYVKVGDIRMKNKLKLEAFGAAGEVGRSCFVISDSDRKIALDCGIMLRPKQPSLAPVGVDPIAKDLNAVILSHAHIDHSGYIPALYHYGFEGEIHATPPTIDITYVLWKDHLNIEGERHWNEEDMENATFEGHLYKKKFKVADGIYATFYQAGHILGAAQILLEWDGQLILYTGDINDKKTPLFDGFEIPDKEPIDIVITEATNGVRPIPPREKVGEDFKTTVEKAVKRKAKVITPSFAIGRSQEIEFLLGDFLDDVPVYIDGMIRKMNAITNYYIRPEWVSPKVFRYLRKHGLSNPFERENFIEITRENVNNPFHFRRMLGKTDNPAIILSTSGMMEGGPIHTHLEVHGEKKENVLAICGYQAEGTLGRAILEGEREIVVNEFIGKPTKIHLKANVETFRFSGHADIDGIKKLISNVSPKKIVIVHSESNEAYNAAKVLTNGVSPIVMDTMKKIDL